MSALNVKSLIGKLNDTCRQSLEAAAGLCMSRTNYNVELEHWLLKLVENPNSDLRVLLKHWDIDSSRVIRDLTKAIDRFKTGNSRPPALAPQVMDLAREGWLLASIDYGVGKARSAHLLLALVADDQLSRLMTSAVPDLAKISVEAFRKELPDIIGTAVRRSG